MSTPIRQFFKEHGISEVEAVVPDMAGIARGKIMPAEKFTTDEGMKLPESIFLQTVTGDYPSDTSGAMSPTEMDIVLKAGYHGYVGIEYEGSKISEDDGIVATKKLLERVLAKVAADKA